MLENFLRAFSRHQLAYFLHSRSLNIGDTSKFLQQFLRSPCPHSGNILERCFRLTFAAALPVERNREAVSLVPDLLNQVEDGRVAVQHDGFVLLAKDVEDL